MSLDRRLRDGLRRSSAVVDPDVSRNLATVRRRTRRLVIRQRATKALLAMALVATVVFAGPWMLEVIRSQRDRPVATPSPAALLGAYKADLTGAGGELAGARLAGPWTLTLNGDGSMLWEPPPGSGVAEGLPRDTYQATGTQIVTNLFQANLCQGVGVGTYTWTRSGATLTLAAVRDGCTLRRAILTTAPWTAP
jgi:hypothetical protein